MKEITAEMLKELENNEAFVTEMNAAKTMQDVANVLSSYGIEMTIEELENGYKDAIAQYTEMGYIQDDELTEKGLDMVSGGFNGGVSSAGIYAGCAGLLLMMSGPIGWGSVALWAGGCAVGALGVVLPGKKRR